MNISIIGAGNVGTALGSRFTETGHAVRYGVRNPQDPNNQKVDASDVATAAKAGDILILAVPFTAAEGALTNAGDLSGKIVIDATNPIASDFSGLENLNGSSAGEIVAGLAPNAKVVKAFNTIGFNIMENPILSGQPATLLIAGDDSGAKEVVATLAKEIGFAPVDAGPLSMSRYLEAFAWIWITLALKQGIGRDFAFGIVKRSPEN